VRFVFFYNFCLKIPHSKNNSSRYYKKFVCIDLHVKRPMSGLIHVKHPMSGVIHVKHPMSGLIKLVFSLQVFEKKLLRFDKIAPQLETSCSLRTDGETWRSQ
jgi:hypothetical protein